MAWLAGGRMCTERSRIPALVILACAGCGGATTACGEIYLGHDSRGVLTLSDAPFPGARPVYAQPVAGQAADTGVEPRAVDGDTDVALPPPPMTAEPVPRGLPRSSGKAFLHGD